MLSFSACGEGGALAPDGVAMAENLSALRSPPVSRTAIHPPRFAKREKKLSFQTQNVFRNGFKIIFGQFG